MDNPSVSIILPCYNGERFLEKAIQSCLDQTWTDWELIIVDDASTDSTPDIINRYASMKSNISTVRLETNLGLPAALNSGFSQARGRYLTWTSDDNQYAPTALAEMLDVLDNNVTVAVVYADYTVQYESKSSTQRIHVGDPSRINVSNCVGPCFLYRREVHERLGGYAEDLFLAEDYDFWLRASAEFKMQALQSDLYLYRWHGKSLTSQKDVAVVKVTARARARFYRQHPEISGQIKARGWFHQVESSVRCRKPWLAKQYLLRALLAAPVWVLGNWSPHVRMTLKLDVAWLRQLWSFVVMK